MAACLEPSAQQLKEMSSEELARRSQDGCRASFAELAERYAGPLLQFLAHRTNNIHDAEDLVQETFILAYKKIGRYRSSYKFSTWLFTIARRLAASRSRAAARRPVLGPCRRSSPQPQEMAARREAAHGLWAAAGTLPLGQYQVLRLRYAEQMSIKQIAKVMGKSRVGIRVLLYRARMELAEKLRAPAGEQDAAERVSSKRGRAYTKKVEGL